MALNMLESSRSFVRNLRALRAAERSHSATVLTRHGEPSAVVVPFDEQMEGWALARSPGFLEDIDQAEREIAAGTVRSLDDALDELGMDHELPAAASVEVGAAVEEILAGLFSTASAFSFSPRGRSMVVSGANFAGEGRVVVEMQAPAVRRSGRGSGLPWVRGGAPEREDAPEVEVSMQKVGEDQTEIAVSLKRGYGRDMEEHAALLQQVEFELGQFKSQLETSHESFER
jgi:PHD/YefM family antitoxin component YafN of YafNO toxin-antitoxin module